MAAIFTILTVRAAFVVVAIVSISLAVAAAISHNQPPRPDPFAAYADIMPGQPREAVTAHGFTCDSSGPPLYQQSCSLTPETGTFSEIKVSIDSSTGAVNRIVFTPKNKSLSLGQLALLWGWPEAKGYAGITNLRWGSYNTVAIPQTYHGHVSYELPITYVAFESAD